MATPIGPVYGGSVTPVDRPLTVTNPGPIPNLGVSATATSYQSYDTFLQMGAKPEDKREKGVGDFVKNVGIGFYEGARDTVMGVVFLGKAVGKAIIHPIETAKKIGNGVVNAVKHPGDTLKTVVTFPIKVGKAIIQPYADAIKTGQYGKAVGRLGFDAVMIYLTGKASDLAKSGSAAGRGASAAGSAASNVATNVADDVAKGAVTAAATTAAPATTVAAETAAKVATEAVKTGGKVASVGGQVLVEGFAITEKGVQIGRIVTTSGQVAGTVADDVALGAAKVAASTVDDVALGAARVATEAAAVGGGATVVAVPTATAVVAETAAVSTAGALTAADKFAVISGALDRGLSGITRIPTSIGRSIGRGLSSVNHGLQSAIETVLAGPQAIASGAVNLGQAIAKVPQAIIAAPGAALRTAAAGIATGAWVAGEAGLRATLFALKNPKMAAQIAVPMAMAAGRVAHPNLVAAQEMDLIQFDHPAPEQ